MNLNTPKHKKNENPVRGLTLSKASQQLVVGVQTFIDKIKRLWSVKPPHGYKGRFAKFNVSAEKACCNYNTG